jgi:hypothetical protein
MSVLRSLRHNGRRPIAESLLLSHPDQMRPPIVLALLAILLEPAASPALKRPSFFMEPGYSHALLRGIDMYTGEKIDFDRHISLTFVPCGIGCGSFWLVDRRTGGVIEVPTIAAADQDTWDVVVKPDSDTITVFYGPRDPVDARCSARQFRWTGSKFVALTKLAPAKCPE